MSPLSCPLFLERGHAPCARSRTLHSHFLCPLPPPTTPCRSLPPFLPPPLVLSLPLFLPFFLCRSLSVSLDRSFALSLSFALALNLVRSLCLALARGPERLVIYCQTTGVSPAHAARCATYCTPCRPLIRAFSGWIRTPPPTHAAQREARTPGSGGGTGLSRP